MCDLFLFLKLLPNNQIDHTQKITLHLIFQERISAVFTAVQAEGVRDLQQALERKKLVQARDVQGRTPLHLAVLSGKKEAVEYIVQNFPEAIKCTDNVSFFCLFDDRKCIYKSLNLKVCNIINSENF